MFACLQYLQKFFSLNLYLKWQLQSHIDKSCCGVELGLHQQHHCQANGGDAWPEGAGGRGKRNIYYYMDKNAVSSNFIKLQEVCL